MTLATLVEFIGRISLWSGRVSAVLVPPLVFAMVYEVVSRYFFDAPTQWAFELSYMMMGAIFLLGLCYAVKVDQHVKVDFLHARLPARAIALIDGLCYAILTAMLIWLTRTLIFNAINVYNTGEGSGLSAWNPKIWPYRVVYAVGFGLFALQCLARTIENLAVAFGRQLPEPRA